ncbi:flavin reductase family protein [Lachnospiraceae bacterium ZAX-1]
MKKSIGKSQTAFPTPVFVVGTYDEAGKANAATIAWAGVASSGPESVAIAVRPSRYTYENLLLKKAFTVNIPSAEYAVETDYLGIDSGRNVDKLKRVGLTSSKADYVDAPVINEFPVSIECEVTHTLDLGVHVLFIGAIKDIKAEERFLSDKGVLDIRAAGLLLFDAPNHAYVAPGGVIAQAFSVGLKFR